MIRRKILAAEFRWGGSSRGRTAKSATDVIKAYWDLSGAVEDCQLFFLVGYQVANAAQMPQWNPGSEFKAIRDASLKKAQSKGN